MMERFMSSKNTNPIQYGVFDVLYANNDDVTNLPLSQRKQILGVASGNRIYLNFDVRTTVISMVLKSFTCI